MKRKYIVNSIFGKRLKVVEDNEDIMECKVICPHCGKEVLFGTEITMISGNSCCINCSEKLLDHILSLKANNYEEYKIADFEPYGLSREECEKLDKEEEHEKEN